MGSIVRSIGAPLLSLAVFFALLEGVARLAGYAPEEPINPTMHWLSKGRPYWTMELGKTWYTRPGGPFGFPVNPGNPAVPGNPVIPNSLGIRGPEILPKQASETRILVLGDSVSFGFGVADEESFPRRIDRALGENVSVVNASIAGWARRQQRLFLEYHLESLEPDIILISVVHNDISELQASNFQVQAAVYAASSLAWLAERSGAVAAAKDFLRTSRPRRPTVAGPQRRRGFADNPDVLAATDLEIDELTRIEALANERAIPLGLILNPYKFQTKGDPAPELREPYFSFATERYIPILDLLPAFLQNQEDVLFLDFSHYSARGNEVAAAAIVAWIQDEGMLESASENSGADSTRPDLAQ